MKTATRPKVIPRYEPRPAEMSLKYHVYDNLHEEFINQTFLSRYAAKQWCKNHGQELVVTE